MNNTIDRPRMTEARINKYFELAKQACKFSDNKQHQLGAVITYKGRILSTGYNTNKTNPVQEQYNKFRGYDVTTAKNSLHAEISAILKCKDMKIDWNKANIHIYREHKNGVKALAKPCKACEKAIKDLGIKNIYYTIECGIAHEKFD